MTQTSPASDPLRTHRAVWELLPWHVNQTLDSAESTMVEAHLSACIACRSEVNLLRQVERNIREADLLDESLEGSLARARARIETDANDGVPIRRSVAFVKHWLTTLGTILRGSHPAIKMALAAQTAVLLVGLSVFLAGPISSRDDAAFQTLSARSKQATASRLRVVVADNVSERKWRELLLSESLQIVDGPSPTGVYSLAPGSSSEPAAIERARDRLDAAGEIRFVTIVSVEADQRK